MADQDYLAPVRYEPPGPARRPLPWWSWLLLLGVLALIGGGWLLLSLIARGTQTMLREHLPPAAVHVGQPLAWRELSSGSLGVPLTAGMLGGLFTADFDADGDDEVLVIHVRGKSQLYDVDGTRRPAGISGMQFMLGGAAWDLDRDGIAEIVVDPSLADAAQASQSDGGRRRQTKVLPVYDLDGRIVASLPALGGETAWGLLTGDMTGDGHDEIVATGRDVYERYSPRGKVAFGPGGEEVWRLPDERWHGRATLGDVDGDGRAEFITTYDNPLKLEVYGVDQPRAELTGWQRLGSPEFCVDITGDGRDEVISPGLGFLNPGTAQLVEFQFPADVSSSLAQVSGICCCGDFTGDGLPDVAVASRIDSWLALFDETGRCRYYEELGDLVFSMACLRAGGQDHLALQLAGRLLIYP